MIMTSEVMSKIFLSAHPPSLYIYLQEFVCTTDKMPIKTYVVGSTVEAGNMAVIIYT